MEIIVEENCENRQLILGIVEQIKENLEQIVTGYSVTSLKYIVVADANIENFAESVKKYADEINVDVSLTNDENYSVAGKTIDGINDKGEYQQCIILKYFLIYAMYCDMFRKLTPEAQQIPNMNDLENTGHITVIHEIGHAVDNQYMYQFLGRLNDKVMFDLSSEYEEYIENMAYSLWKEYFAETFPFVVLGTFSADSKIETGEKELINCIDSYSKGKTTFMITERVYRILYLFVHCLSKYHGHQGIQFDYTILLENPKTQGYVPYLSEIETDLRALSKGYPKWNPESCMNEFVMHIKQVLEYEINN